ncbi:MAG TPA: AraC family transcriptional regulator [Trueperaceae bacterium]
MHPRTLKKLSRARAFMRDAYGERISLEAIAGEANLSPYHFLRVYKEAFLETPNEFVTRLRLEQAKSLLAKGSHSVTEACFEVGFSGLGSFSGLFKDRVGVTPSAYQRYARSSVLVATPVRALFIPSCFFDAFHIPPQPQTARFEKRAANP